MRYCRRETLRRGRKIARAKMRIRIVRLEYRRALGRHPRIGQTSNLLQRMREAQGTKPGTCVEFSGALEPGNGVCRPGLLQREPTRKVKHIEVVRGPGTH